MPLCPGSFVLAPILACLEFWTQISHFALGLQTRMTVLLHTWESRQPKCFKCRLEMAHARSRPDRAVCPGCFCVPAIFECSRHLPCLGTPAVSLPCPAHSPLLCILLHAHSPPWNCLLLSSRALPPGLHLVCISLPFLSLPLLCLDVQSVAFPKPSFPPLFCMDFLTHPPHLTSLPICPGQPFHFLLLLGLIALPTSLFPCKATDCLALPLNPCLAFCSFAHPSLTWNPRPHFSGHVPALSCPAGSPEDSQG